VQLKSKVADYYNKTVMSSDHGKSLSVERNNIALASVSLDKGFISKKFKIK
jgi:hypothetical protein